MESAYRANQSTLRANGVHTSSEAECDIPVRSRRHREDPQAQLGDTAELRRVPVAPGAEIESTIADDPERSLITLQVEMGVAVRMAGLELLLA